MKNILLISDTHSHLDNALLKYIEAADEVWHAGDIGCIEVTDGIKKLKPLRAVYGNIDDANARNEFPKNLVFSCEGVKVFITHICGQPTSYLKEVKDTLLAEKPKLFICGHSHILKVMYQSQYDVLHMNPGACGIHGFHQVKTALRFVIDGEEIKDLAIIELGSRVSIG
ncbi:MAG: YfcE family phosphodiesterase [Bacteroidetes bacterium]|nr:YfcE family phosphodiesterase [Bacteroidota bacterium]MDF2452532.1 YfcE family phosphodiesterase [Bacteroidota bacterium]